jgi:hypothetical protein
MVRSKMELVFVSLVLSFCGIGRESCRRKSYGAVCKTLEDFLGQCLDLVQLKRRFRVRVLSTLYVSQVKDYRTLIIAFA